MTKTNRTPHDGLPEIERFINELKEGNFNATLPVSIADDAVKPIIEELNELACSLKKRYVFNQTNTSTVLSANHDVVFWICKDGNIIDMQANDEDLIRPRNTFEGINVTELLTPEQGKLFLRTVKNVLKTGKMQLFPHDNILDGKHYYFEGRIVKVDDETVLMIARDVTQQRKAELINDVNYNIALKAGERGATTQEFTSFIEEQILRIFECDEFYISKWDGTETLTFIHISSDEVKKKTPYMRKNGNGLSEYVLRSGDPLLLRGDEVMHFQLDNDLTVHGPQSKAWIGVPLMASGKTIGVIACQAFENENLFDDVDLELLASVGGHIGLWLQQKETEEQQSSFVRVFDNSLNEIFIFDEETLQFSYANKGGLQNLGYDQEEFYEMTPLDILPEFDETTLRAFINSLLTGEESLLAFESFHKRKDGSLYPVEVHLQHSFFNRRSSFTAIIIDIQERKMAEKEIQEYANFFSVSMELMCIVDPSGYFKKVNALFTQLLGYTEEELLNTKYYNLIHPDDFDSTRKAISDLKQGKPAFNFTNRYRCKDGTYKWLSWNSAPNHETGILYASARDVTPIVQTENALKASERQFRSLADNAPSFIVTLNKAHNIEYINRVEHQFTKEDVLGMPVYAFVNPEDHDMVRSKINQIFIDGYPSSFETSIPVNDNDIHHYQTNLGPIKNEDGEVTSIIMIIQDITDQITSKHRVETAYTELKLIDRINVASIQSQSLLDLAQLTMENFTELIPIENGRFYLYNEMNNQLILKKEKLQDKFIAKIEERIGVKINSIVPEVNEGSCFHKALTEQQIVIARTPEDVVQCLKDHTNSRLLKKFAGWSKDIMKIKSFLVIPLIANQKIFGLITLSSQQILDDKHIEKVRRFMHGTTMALAKTIAEQEILNQKKFIEDVLYNLPSEISVFDQNYKYLFVNPATISNSAVRNEVIGQKESDYLKNYLSNEKKAKEHKYYFDHAKNTGSEVTWVDTFSRDGEEKHFMRKFHPVIENDQLKYMLSYGVDITDRVKVENRNRELASIFAYSNDAIINLSKTGHIVAWNKGATKLFGYERNEMMGQHIATLNPPNSKGKSSKEIISKIIEIGKGMTVETQRLHKSGRVIEISLSVFPLFDAKGELRAISGIMRDISERKQTEVALKRSEASLKEAQKLTRLGSWEWDVQTDMVKWSDELYRIFELDEKNKKKITLDVYSSLIHPEDSSTVMATINKTFETKESYKITHRIKTNSKSPKYVESRGHVELDELGEIARFYGTCMDVTEREMNREARELFTKKLEEKVRERTEELQISLNENKHQEDTLNQIALVSTTDTNGNITYANDAFCTITGYSLEELIGQNHRILKSSGQNPKFFNNLWKTISEGNIWKGEMKNTSKDGKVYWIFNTIVPFFDLNGTIEKYVSVSFDITEQKKLQEKLKSSLDREMELGELKSRFVSTASHQFRTPMAIINSNSQLLNMIVSKGNSELKPQLEKATDRIQTEVKRMTNLMDDILILGKINSGSTMNVSKAPMDFHEFCENIANQFNAIHANGRSVSVGKKGRKKSVVIDAKLMSHAMNNLVSNALKYSKENVYITINYKKEDLEVSVEDSGMGIPKEDLPNLFQAFHRATNVGEIQGTGLGLAIVKEYVELSDGIINVESELNKGSRFTITIPYK